MTALVGRHLRLDLSLVRSGRTGRRSVSIVKLLLPKSSPLDVYSHAGSHANLGSACSALPGPYLDLGSFCSLSTA